MISYNTKDWLTVLFRFHKADTIRKLFSLIQSLMGFAIFIYILTPPIGYVFDLGCLVIPAVAFVFYVLASLELIAEIIRIHITEILIPGHA
ncbi:hypothetical protein [Flavihumibacter profundi]|jgi:hypothetical protein|uniref:hypothetical protein n=1 Tax=Flavihumibacter profundi TaxID=2716883 RepID=UPI001CC63702|nr:hypothetical protein [Flavihumibacter profundi]MBZ5857235.1 hypothetical protein [Flavihumibacter profundi]